MSAATSDLQEVRGFTRGFLLAMDWAGQPTDANVADRVPQLGGEDMNSLYRAFRALPRESRRAMRTTWAKRDRLRRVDEAVDLHSSWMVRALEKESPALFLLALGELEPNLARSVLRELWPKIRPRPDAAVGEMHPLTPAHAGAFRRFLYGSWVNLAGNQAQNPVLAPLLSLGAGPLWLLAQEFGRWEIERLGARLSGEHPSPRVQAAYAAGRDGNERVGLAGLHLLASLLSDYSRSYALHIAQRMPLSVATPFLRWRDEAAASHGPGAGRRTEGAGPESGPQICPCPADEILERARSLNADEERGGE